MAVIDSVLLSDREILGQMLTPLSQKNELLRFPVVVFLGSAAAWCSILPGHWGSLLRGAHPPRQVLLYMVSFFL